MNRKEKPVQATTRTRAIKTKQSYHTPAPDQFQCPRCQLSGNTDLFTPGWPDQLHELIARHPGLGISGDLSGMNYQDARLLYNWLVRYGC
ncbi:MAG: hypothetical protein A2W76_05295 [Gammaproteobacteria bacterium RIFCSPLOWO2_12_47_11]|nr:MAG: hypothetical protein A2W76_05295 [Gammaproteobacteria bacterium RIFCSPLOWO2_12_47_11]